MRWHLAVVFAAALAPVAALAQSPAWTPAPVPNRTSNVVDPSARAGRADGAERAAPLSGLPSVVGSRDDAGSTTVDPSSSGSSAVPSLSR